MPKDQTRLPGLDPDRPARAAPVDLSPLPQGLLVGTSSFSTTDWIGPFYPPGTKPAQFLSFYATVFRTVEIDATWHAMPSRAMVEGWAAKVPRDFVFALKVPKVITHEKGLTDCRAEWQQFLRNLEPLGDQLGPLLFQFPYIAKGRDANEWQTGADFTGRLASFLPDIPKDLQVAVEVRNDKWIAPPLLDLLRSRDIALSLIDYYTMPPAIELMAENDLVTAPFGYVRFLGNHKSMDKKVAAAKKAGTRRRSWDELLVDRTDATRAWLPALQKLLDHTERLFVYYNNHYAGHAPGSIRLLCDLWSEDS